MAASPHHMSLRLAGTAAGTVAFARLMVSFGIDAKCTDGGRRVSSERPYLNLLLIERVSGRRFHSPRESQARRGVSPRSAVAAISAHLTLHGLNLFTPAPRFHTATARERSPASHSACPSSKYASTRFGPSVMDRSKKICASSYISRSV